MTDSKGPITLIGTGGHAVVVAALARATGFEPARLIDPVGGSEVASSLRALPLTGYEGLEGPAALAIGHNAFRAQAYEAAKTVDLPTLIHPTASVEADAEVAPAAHVCIGAIIATGARIATGAIINSGAIVEHENEIGAFAHISPGAALSGRVTVGPWAHVGVGARVIQGITIGAGATVGAGAVVVRDVPENTTVVGVPARAVPSS